MLIQRPFLIFWVSSVCSVWSVVEWPLIHEIATASFNQGGARKWAACFTEEETYAIRGAVFEVDQVMGCGFVEPVYQECLEMEFRQRGLPCLAQQELILTYKGDALKQIYKPDFICFGKIIVELKALKEIAPEHRAQLMNYLKATGLKLGLLVNLGSYPRVAIERLVI